MTQIYLALDDKHRDAVRPIMVARFKDVSKSAKIAWNRFCDSVQFLPSDRFESNPLSEISSLMRARSKKRCARSSYLVIKRRTQFAPIDYFPWKCQRVVVGILFRSLD